MTTPDRTDRLVRDWMAVAAPPLPESVVERALAGLPAIPQQRSRLAAPWTGAPVRPIRTGPAIRAAVALGAAAALAVATAVVLPAARPDDGRIPRGPDLSTMATQDIEQGVVRLMDDGAGHDLDRPFDEVVASPDGAVWLLPRRADGFALGRAGSVVARSFGVYPAERTVTPDGADWLAGMESGLLSSGPRGVPTVLPKSPHPGRAWHVGQTPDGTVWAGYDLAVARRAPDGTVTAWRLDDGTLPRPNPNDRRIAGLEVSTDGDVWVGTAGERGPEAGFFNRGTSSGGLLRRTGDAWQTVEISPLLEVFDPLYAVVPIGAGDDRLWVLAVGEPRASEPADSSRDRRLAVLGADATWDLIPLDVAPDLGLALPYGGRAVVRAGPDGRLWYPHVDGGVASFDGTTETRYLAPIDGRLPDDLGRLQHRWCTGKQDQSGVCVGAEVADLAVGLDGTVWMVRRPEIGGRLYAIRP